MLDTGWRVAAEPAAVWSVLAAVEAWPAGWQRVLAAERLADGNPGGLSRRYRTPWRGRLPYVLTFETDTIRIERPVLIESRARGPWQGTGIWRLRPDGAATRVRDRWAARSTPVWPPLMILSSIEPP